MKIKKGDKFLCIKDVPKFSTEEAFIELNGLEKPATKEEQEEIYDEDPYNWVNNAMRKSVISNKKDEIVQNIPVKEVFNPQPHYDNSKGSLYKVATDLNLNHWEFDIFKRLVRCRKKGQFKQDLQKIKDTIDIYIKEYESK